MTHWAIQYIGRSWSREHDCWEFFRRVQLSHFDLFLPAVDIDSGDRMKCARQVKDDEERSNWTPTGTPTEGDAVLMAHSKFPSHVGIWIESDGGGVLHCQEGTGVIFSTRQALSKNGWAHVRYYRHVSKT